MQQLKLQRTLMRHKHFSNTLGNQKSHHIFAGCSGEPLHLCWVPQINNMIEGKQYLGGIQPVH